MTHETFHTPSNGNTSVTESAKPAKPIILNLDPEVQDYLNGHQLLRADIVSDLDRNLRKKVAESKARDLIDTLRTGGIDVSNIRSTAEVEANQKAERQSQELEREYRKGYERMENKIKKAIPVAIAITGYALIVAFAAGTGSGAKAAVSALGPVAKFFMKKGL